MCFFCSAGCASGPRLNTSHPSANHDNRMQFVVVHYTSTNLERSLALLTHGEVSAHYLIGDDASPPSTSWWMKATRLARGRKRVDGAYLAQLQLHRDRIVNPGYKDTPTGRVWYPYTEAQVQALIVLLKDIVQAQRASTPRPSSATATSRRCASSTRARCSLGSAWPTKASAYGRDAQAVAR